MNAFSIWRSAALNGRSEETAALFQKISTCNDAIAAANQQITELRENNATLTNDVASKQGKVDELTAELDASSDQISVHLETIASARKAMDEKEQHIALERAHVAAKTELHCWRTSLQQPTTRKD